MEKHLSFSVLFAMAVCLPFALSAQGFQQPARVNGRVTVDGGEPAPGATVGLQGTGQSTLTDDQGKFSFSRVSPGTYQLTISLLGYRPYTEHVNVKEDKSISLEVHLKATSEQLQEVVVRTQRNKFTAPESDDAAKMPLKDLENPQSYTTVTSALFTEQSAHTMDKAMENIAGVSRLWAATDRAGFGNGTAYALRGFELNANLRNGIAGNISTTIDNANIERVEVLKGPSATLFGSTVTSYGGLINRVTKKPYDSLGGELSYTNGSYGYNRLTADFNTPLDSAKKVLFRVNAAYNYSNTWQDQGYHKDFFLAPTLTYQASDRLKFSLDAEFYKSRGTTPQILFFDATVPQLGVSSADNLNIDYKRSFISNDLSMSSTNANFYWQMDYKLSDGWSSRSNVTVSNTSSYGPMPYFYLLPGNQQMARNVWTIDGKDNALDIQQNFVGKFLIGSLRNRLVAGLDFYNYNANVVYHEFLGTAGGTTAADLFDVVNMSGDVPNYYGFNKAKVDSAYANGPADPYPYININKEYVSSAYFSDVLNVTDRLLVNVGLRLDRFDNKGNYDAVTGKTSGGYHQTALSPKFGLVYELVKDRLSLFGNYQNGFTNENGTDFSGKAFKPEQANQWEGGVKVNAFAGRLSGTFSYYDIQVTDVIRTDPDHANFSIQNGTQQSRGVEANLIANPFDGFNIIAGYAHNEGKYTKADPDVNGRRPGSSGPADMANFWVSYRIAAGQVNGLGAGFGANYAGKNVIESSVSQGIFTCPAYTTLKATVFYDRPRYRLSVNVDNLTNQKYWIGWTTVNPQPLRSFYASATFRF